FGRLLKRPTRARELPIPLPLRRCLSRHVAHLSDHSPSASLFPTSYGPTRTGWARICRAAGIFGATLHDARHTFAVHAVQDGVPEARLQRLLGHSHYATTRRYAMHAPEQFMDRDVRRVARSLGLTRITPPRTRGPLSQRVGSASRMETVRDARIRARQVGG